jgi:hypothetical protein
MNDRELTTLIRMAMEAESLEPGAREAAPVIARIGPGWRRTAGLVAGFAAAAGIAVVIWPGTLGLTQTKQTPKNLQIAKARDDRGDIARLNAETAMKAGVSGIAKAEPSTGDPKSSSDFDHPLAASPEEGSFASQVLVVLRDAKNACGCEKIQTVDWSKKQPAGSRLIYARADADPASPTLNVNDFACFHKSFASGDSAANCDGSTTGPMLSVNDLVCFTSKFAHGCM